MAVIASALPLASFANDLRYWVWQRDDPLDEQELAELEAQKIDTIYWQAGELEKHQRDLALESAIQFPIVQRGSHPFRACGAAGLQESTNRFPTHRSQRCWPVCLRRARTVTSCNSIMTRLIGCSPIMRERSSAFTALFLD